MSTVVFNGDGTGSATGQEVSVTYPPVASGSADKVSFTLTYQVAADRTVIKISERTGRHVAEEP